MSGHNKWASIKHKKGAADAKRGKIFTKIIKEISISTRLGGSDIEANPRLRTAILKAKSANMPKDNIERAIKKGAGELEGVNYVEITYEAYGPGGVALLIDALTDNKNRTAADVRNILSKGNGRLGDPGCVAYLFKRKGIINYDKESVSEEKIFEAALEAGAEDVTSDNSTIEVLTEPEDLENVLKELQKAGFEETMAEIAKVPDTTVALDNDTLVKALKLIDHLDDHDDIQSISSNLDIPDDFEMDDE